MKEAILARCREALRGREKYDMPDLTDIGAITWDDPLTRFLETCGAVGAGVMMLDDMSQLDDAIHKAYPDARTICTNIPEVKSATSNPDNVDNARELDGLDVGVVKGSFGVAENGAVWVEQTMRQRVVCFIAENLVIVMPKDKVVNNMHEAYPLVTFNSCGYGVFIAGPSKTADIAQVLVSGAQAARSVTVMLVDHV